MPSIHSGRLERWVGQERLDQISKSMRGWYGPPIHILDVPGSVRVTADGDFIGKFERGYFMSAMDAFALHVRQMSRRIGRIKPHGQFGVGFPGGVSEALARASAGYKAYPGGNIAKTGPTGVVGVTSSLWRVGPQPAAGSAGAAAPGGTAHTSSNTGALSYPNPGSGTMHLTGANISASVINNTLLLYDRLFSVAKTMASTATEAVTGVPTRYQSTTPGNADYASGNFLFVEVGGTALSATAHNWTVCTYTDQDGNTGATLPSLTGNSSAIVDRLDHPTQQFFAPLASGDTGIKNLTQMQCSASVATGAINFVIGHAIGFMTFPVINSMMPFDWLTNIDQAPRVFDSACLAFLEIMKPATTATSYSGQIILTNAAA